MEKRDVLEKALTQNHLNVTTPQVEQLLKYLELLFQWNKVFNLTAIHDFNEAVTLHIIDSLLMISHLHGERIIDVGSGAGLPGIPLAIVCPEKVFTLLDSNGKKTRFLNQVKIELALLNVEVIHSRVEDFHPSHGFDSIITRAFSSLEEMVQCTHHLLAPKGLFLAMKGVYPAEEIERIPVDFKVRSLDRLTIKGLKVERHLVKIEHP